MAISSTSPFHTRSHLHPEPHDELFFPASHEKRYTKERPQMVPSTSTPSFGDLEYWNTRFRTEEKFDWLADFGVLEPWLKKIIDAKSAAGGREERKHSRPQILHVGCGSSSLSTQLRGLVESADKLHNCDYSDVVIERGRQREKNLLHDDSFGRGAICSRWSTLDLLSLNQVLEFRRGGDYDVIVDKSTSDAISCAEDVEAALPYRINTSTLDHDTALGMASVYPPHILAVHLAYLATPGCHWVVLSYSSSRFGGWEDEKMPQGLPPPGRLWKMIRHEKLIQPPDPEDKVHRPPETHHLYILERTELEVKEL